MKSFIALKNLLPDHKASRKALRAYALYRSCKLAGDTSLAALKSFHLYESTGVLPEGIENAVMFSKTNGYANGKWILELTRQTVFEDIQTGKACKSEFYSKKKMQMLFPKQDWMFNNHKYQRSSWFWDKCLDTCSAGSFYTKV